MIGQKNSMSMLCTLCVCGRYLESNPHIPTSFLISTKSDMLKFDHYNYDNGTNSRELRVLVQQQLNAKYCELSNPVSGRSN